MKTKQAIWLMGLLALAAGCNKGGSAVSVPATPDGMMKAVLDSLSDNQPRVVWDCLPASYQKDVTGLIHKFGGKVDGEVWDKAFVVLGKATKLLRDKREFVLQSPAAGAMASTDKSKVNPAFDQLLSALDALASSDIKTVDGLKKIDPGAFLATTGAKVFKAGREMAAVADTDNMTKMIDDAKKAKITVEKSEGDKATLKVEVGNEPPKTVQLTKVDGKWLPAEVVAAWQQAIAQADAQLDQLDMSGPMKMQGLGLLAGVEAGIDQLAGATTQEDFNARAQAIMGMLPFGGGMQGPPPTDLPNFDSPLPDDAGSEEAQRQIDEIRANIEQKKKDAVEQVDELKESLDSAADSAADAAADALEEAGVK